jgi:hypothetical protein
LISMTLLNTTTAFYSSGGGGTAAEAVRVLLAACDGPVAMERANTVGHVPDPVACGPGHARHSPGGCAGGVGGSVMRGGLLSSSAAVRVRVLGREDLARALGPNVVDMFVEFALREAL